MRYRWKTLFFWRFVHLHLKIHLTSVGVDGAVRYTCSTDDTIDKIHSEGRFRRASRAKRNAASVVMSLSIYMLHGSVADQPTTIALVVVLSTVRLPARFTSLPPHVPATNAFPSSTQFSVRPRIFIGVPALRVLLRK